MESSNQNLMDAKFSSLLPFNSTPGTAPFRLSARAEFKSGEIRLTFKLEADSKARLANLPPLSTPPSRKDGLWETTCFEAFLGVKNSSAYFEFNGAPSGDWGWYSFTGYRQGMASPALASSAQPRLVETRRTDTTFEMAWSIPLEALSGAEVDCVGLTAVLDQAGEISYWALKHACGEADFHDRASFTLTI